MRILPANTFNIHCHFLCSRHRAGMQRCTRHELYLPGVAISPLWSLLKCTSYGKGNTDQSSSQQALVPPHFLPSAYWRPPNSLAMPGRGGGGRQVTKGTKRDIERTLRHRSLTDINIIHSHHLSKKNVRYKKAHDDPQ